MTAHLCHSRAIKLCCFLYSRQSITVCVQHLRKLSMKTNLANHVQLFGKQWNNGFTIFISCIIKPISSKLIQFNTSKMKKLELAKACLKSKINCLQNKVMYLNIIFISWLIWHEIQTCCEKMILTLHTLSWQPQCSRGESDYVVQ